MGLHTGVTDERDGDYFGPVVIRAARIMGVAHGGQIVLSEVTAGLLADTSSVRLVDLGHHSLRGFAAATRLFGVDAEGVPWPDRPLMSVAAVLGNLPRPASEFIGRTEDVKSVVEALGSSGVVTLAGAGGSGKTRLAIEAASLLADDFSDGAWFVDLAPVAEGDAAVHAAASVLGARAQEGLSMVDAIADWARHRRLLVVLDNCEHVLDAIAALVAHLGQAAPAMRILATSREPLGVPGEHVYVVPPLDVDTDAVALFCDRARSANSAIVFDEQALETITQVCRRLDGLPLAIELAAGRSRSLTPADLLAHLDDRFRLLRGGGRGLARHQTIRATVSWSYQLLTPEEQLLFDRLSVFAGSFDLAAAEAVAADDALVVDDVIDLLGTLVDKSMVVAAAASGGPGRYRLLETLRQYGQEQLAARGELTAARDRHLVHYQTGASALLAAYLADHTDAVAARWAGEWDNQRAAHEWAIERGRCDAAVALTVDTTWYSIHTLRFEHEQWVRRTLDLVGDHHVGSGGLLGLAGVWATLRGDQDVAIPLALRGLEVTAPDDVMGRFICQGALAVSYVNSGRPELALDAAHAGEALAGDDPGMLAMCLGYLLWVSWAADTAAVPRYAAKHREVARQLHAQLDVEFGEGLCHLLAGDAASAYDVFVRYRERLRGTKGAAEGEAVQCLALAASVLDNDDTDAVFHEAITELYDTRYWMYLWIVVETLATYWVRVGRIEEGAVLLGHLEAHRRRHATLMTARADALSAVIEQPGAAARMANGAQMDQEQLVTFVLDRLQQRAANAGA
jgi:predicted ATPase